MAAVDAQFHWMSAKIPSDECLVYAFDGVPQDFEAAVAQVLGRARSCPGLTVRVDDTGWGMSYPRWAPSTVRPDQVVRRDARTWDGCLAAVAALADEPVDLRQTPWRLHVFGRVAGVPGVGGAGTIAVLQVPHALGDGARASALAAWLFGRATPVPAVRPSTGFLPWRAAQAFRAHRSLVRDTAAGRLAPGVGDRPPLATNTSGGVRSMRVLTRRRSALPGPTVTVAVLAAVSEALSRLLGRSIDSLGAEVPVGKPGMAQANNHFGNVVVGLYPGLEAAARAERIAADLANGRRRFEHPATRTADRAFATVPAPLLRWGVSRFDVDARPARVLGNTVVSSVNRGAADLSFGGAPVVFTAGGPALSPSMGLAHGVHGIGDTIAITVHAAESAVPDVDAYVELLDAALGGG
jgi:hypothetical protein